MKKFIVALLLSASIYSFAGINISPPPSAGGGSDTTAWTSFTMVITTSGTNPIKGSVITVDEARWRLVGDSMEVHYNYAQTASGSAGSGGAYRFALPSGYEVDTSKITVDTGQSALANVGSASASLGASSVFAGFVKAYSTTQLAMVIGDASFPPIFVSTTTFHFANSTTNLSFRAVVPIVSI